MNYGSSVPSGVTEQWVLLVPRFHIYKVEMKTDLKEIAYLILYIYKTFFFYCSRSDSEIVAVLEQGF